MNSDHLNELVKKLGISRDQILREEAEMQFLAYLGDDKISTKLVFYGGTALRLAYNSPRFSEDIDLVAVKSVKFSEFANFIKITVSSHNTVFADSSWKLSDLKDKKNTMFAVILASDQKLKHNFSIKIEAHKPAKKVKINTQLALIKSPLSIEEPLLLVPTLPELKRLKEDALHDRKKARDVFDLWYIAQSLRENFVLPVKMPSYKKREFENELKVFLPKKYYPVIEQLYAKIDRQN